MKTFSRRSLLSALGVVFPVGLGARAGVTAAPAGPAPVLRFRPFEEAVREALAAFGRDPLNAGARHGGPFPCLRVEVGDSELVRAGVQGCHNDRPFAGFPAGHLRIVRAGSEPGPAVRGVRLYISTVELAMTGGLDPEVPSRPLDFASLPLVPTLSTLALEDPGR